LSNGRVINNHNRDKYNIRKYEYRSSDDISDDYTNGDTSDDFMLLSESLSQKMTHRNDEPKVNVHEDNDSQKAAEEAKHNHGDEYSISDAQTIDMLYKKVEEFSDKVVKLEMALEAKSEESDEKMNTARQEGYDTGFQACSDELKENFKNELNEKEKMLTSSVQKLESSALNYEKRLGEIEKELITTALAISSEVIKIELSQRSSEVALTLAKELLAKLHEASNVTIKVNSNDFELLSKELAENSKITLETDDAIARGGVIVMSSMGNLDGTISSRLEKIIKEATDK
jgi:flagellar assembly protein FliH